MTHTYLHINKHGHTSYPEIYRGGEHLISDGMSCLAKLGTADQRREGQRRFAAAIEQYETALRETASRLNFFKAAQTVYAEEVAAADAEANLKADEELGRKLRDAFINNPTSSSTSNWAATARAAREHFTTTKESE